MRTPRGFTTFWHTVRDEVRALDVRPRALRQFGLVVGGVLAAVGAFVLWRRAWAPGPLPVGLLGLGGLGAALGLAAPRVLLGPYRAWMALAFAMGFVMTRVILTAFWVLVITPAGLVRRTFGRSPVRTRPDPAAETYWITRPPPEGTAKERLERMY